jgi:hypothetical protein
MAISGSERNRRQDVAAIQPALADSHWIEAATGWNINRFVRIASRQCIIQAGPTPSPAPTRSPTRPLRPLIRARFPSAAIAAADKILVPTAVPL